MADLIQSCAYVIHQRPYKNTSALVDFLTLEHGLIRAVVNGLQGKSKNKQHWKGLLQAFNPIAITWKGDGGLKTLIDVERQSQEDSVLPKGKFLYCSFYVNELLQKVLSVEEVDSHLFTIYRKCISDLLAEKDMEMCLRRFESELLQVLGYGIDFEKDIQGQTVLDKHHYEFNPIDGFHLSHKNKPFSIEAKQLYLLAAGDYGDTQTKKIAKYIFRQALQFHIGVGDIKSRYLFKNT